jgi:predicted secreted protein
MSFSDVFAQILIYFLFWFLCLFIVLPFGVKRDESPEVGHDAGAPVNPALKKKALATTLLALVLWGILFYVTHILGYSLQSVFENR